MKYLTKITFTFFALSLLLLSSCNNQSLSKRWFLVGGDIEFFVDLKAKKIQFLEGNTLIFEAQILEQKWIKNDKIRISAKMQKISNSYLAKYSGMNKFLLWIEKKKDNKLIVIFNKLPYHFSKIKGAGKKSPFRLLSNYEISSFMNSSNFKDVRKDYFLEILLNKEPALNEEEVRKQESKANKWVRKQLGVENVVIRKMLDYMTDMNPNTFWSSKEAQFNDTEMEVFLKASSGKKLKKPLKVRALYFRTGNLYKKQIFYKYHRVKKITVSFAKDYEGSLGSTKANYNDAKYTITLPDNIEEKMIVFLKPIPANSIRIEFDDFYMGYENAFAIFDFTVFVDNE